jgi:MAX-like protein X
MFFFNWKMKEHRRVCHINAEQKRRCNIKNGFDMLQSLLPGGSGAGSGSGGSSGSGNSGGGGKSSDVSKAAMLHRGADYIRTLRTERQQQQEELEQLKQNIEVLNTAIRYFDSSRSSELLVTSL